MEASSAAELGERRGPATSATPLQRWGASGLHQRATLQQDVIRLRDQQVDLQAHAEDLKNISCCKNIRIRGVPTAAEGNYITAYVQALFAHIVGPDDAPVQGREPGKQVGPTSMRDNEETEVTQVPTSVGNLRLGPDAMAQEWQAVPDTLAGAPDGLGHA
ncbi:hypothetical protein NDU88_007697 [Pleurodeles waltl]|uniref:Uncharacterized protein n=1 Tax=Pleurodeles waltl TaxID=8319 RepID=A0AAV7N6M3_PLEWA|nr:hypothetical protein NDU88_007697 [Pleurodeles waltl]